MPNKKLITTYTWLILNFVPQTQMQMKGGASYKDEFLVIMALREAY